MAREAVVTLNADKTVALGRDAKYVEGFFIGTKQVPSKLTKSGYNNVHIFQGEGGNIGIWGFYALDQALQSVKAGTMVFVTYKGKEPLKGGKTQHKVLVEQDKDITTFVPSSLSSSYDSSSEPQGFSDEDDVDPVPSSRTNRNLSAQSTDPEIEEAEIEAAEAEDDMPQPRTLSRPPVKSSPTKVSADQQARAAALLNRGRKLA